MTTCQQSQNKTSAMKVDKQDVGTDPIKETVNDVTNVQDEDNNSIKEIANGKADDEEHLIANGKADDEEHLIANSNGGPQPINCFTRCTGPPRHRLVTVEPAMVFLIIAYGTVINLRGQYIKQKVAAEYGVHGDPGEATCGNGNDTDIITNGSDINSLIMAETSRWGTYLSVAESIPTLIVVPILGAWSDKVGRKMVMLIPIVGYILTCLVIIIIMALDLHLNMFFIAQFLQGLSGGLGLFIAVSFSYIADITSEGKRMFRIVIIDMIFLLGAGASQIGIGYFLEYAGYIPPMLMAECFVVLAFFYVITPPFLLETIPRSSSSSAETPQRRKGEVIQNIVNMFKINTGYRRLKLGLAFTACLVIAVTISGGGLIALTALYGQGEPFCWTAVQVGYFTASDLACTAIGALIGGFLLSKCFPDPITVLVTLLDTMLGLFVVATAETSFFIFASSPIGMLRGLPAPVIKTAASKMVTEKEQGALFASLGSIQAVGGLLTPIIVNGVYSATVGFYPPFVFYFLMGLNAVPCVIVCLLHILNKVTAGKEPPPLTAPIHDEEDITQSIN